MQMLAEGARFELAVHVNGRRFSRPVPSTARPPLRFYKIPFSLTIISDFILFTLFILTHICLIFHIPLYQLLYPRN